MQVLKNSILAIKIIFILSLIALCTLSVFSFKNNNDLLTKSNLINHTNLVKAEIANNLLLLIDAETGNRGFLLTGDAVFFDPYKAALIKIPISLRKLDSLMKEDTEQLMALNELKNLTNQRLFSFKFLGDSIKASKKPSEILLKGKREMDNIRLFSAKLINEEEIKLNERITSLQLAGSVAPKISVVFVGFALVMLLFSYLIILKELKKSNNLQTNLFIVNSILEKSNNELAQFAYIASHDLQEPLRKIQTFISRINDNEKTLSENGKIYFDRINKSAKRMQQLILDILSYSRINELTEQKTIVSLNEIITAAKYPLEELLIEKNATIFFSKLPTVSVVKFQFEQLFTNIISNALKFAKPTVNCQININASILKGEQIHIEGINKSINYHRIDIKDNGIGFEQKYEQMIFKIFNRLNSKEAYEGNGIGLSIVKKIMDSHEGFVSAAAITGEGATFTLYLPV